MVVGSERAVFRMMPPSTLPVYSIPGLTFSITHAEGVAARERAANTIAAAEAGWKNGACTEANGACSIDGGASEQIFVFGNVKLVFALTKAAAGAIPAFFPQRIQLLGRRRFWGKYGPACNAVCGRNRSKNTWFRCRSRRVGCDESRRTMEAQRWNATRSDK